MNNIKQICTRLIELWMDDCEIDWEIAQLRTELAKPEPEEPTDEELLEINDGAYCPGTDEANDEDDSSWQYTSDYIRWLDENGTPEEQEAYTAKGLRAVFKAGRRWGRPAPAPQPIPVTERLPEPEDCDAEGMCWWYCAPAERWLRCGIPAPDPASQVHTHWLPANALPLPKEVV